MSDRPGPLGCIGLILFLVLETAAGFAAGALCYPVASRLLAAIVPATQREFGEVVAVILCFVPAAAAAWLVDRLCRRVTGHSVFDWLPDLPNI